MTLVQSPSRLAKSLPRTVGKTHQAIIVIFGVTLAIFGGLGTRLAYLQLVEGNRHRALADINRVNFIPKQPVRGNIFDRHGRVLASSRLSLAVFVWPTAPQQPGWPQVLSRLSQILEIPPEEIIERINRATDNLPVRIARTISPAQRTALEEYDSELTGVYVEVEAVRYYPHGKLAAHILGYTGEIDEEALKQLKKEGYRLSDIIGQMGVESAFEKELRGQWGGQQVEVDNTGKVLRVLGDKPSQAGQDVHLTIDLDLQKAAEAALGDMKGAIVALNPNNGEVLAMVSRPAFDPNIFSSTRITEAAWKEVQAEDHPFVNRAIRVFPPASTYKIITTTAGIESGVFSPYTVLGTYPYLTFGGIQFWDWNQAGFGPLGFVGAMAWSSDTFFYQIGSGIGDDTLIDWTRRYGFGKKTGIELSDEEDPGLVADEEWKLKELGEPWVLGDTINMSIGQGFLLASPLQVGVMFAVPANGGDLVKPHLLKDNQPAKNWRESLNLHPDTVAILREGLRQVVSGGTGGALNVTTLPPVAGKSGTAEDPPRESHSWFGAYAPMDKPEIVVVAFGENSGGGGGSVAAPKVRQVLEAYFKLKQKQAANQKSSK